MRWARALAVLGLVGAAFAAVGAAGAPAAAPASSLQPAVGAYRFADGSVVALFRQPSTSLRLIDYATGVLRELAPRSPDVFVGGPGVSVLTPPRMRVTLVRGRRGAVVALRRGDREARRIPLVTEPAAFRDGDVGLVGKLVRPRGAGPFPAVVIVPGAERATRDTYDLWTYFYASHGFAVLAFDRRGVGASGGTYERAASDDNLRNLAADALAGVDWLRRQPEVDTARIGLSGGSQAGWTIALAASQSARVAFAAIQSGPAMSVGRQLAYVQLTRFGWADPPPTGVEIAAALRGVPDSGYDPRAALAALRIPVLWQLGAVDKRTYVPETVADLDAIMAAGGSHDFTIRVYAGGAHSLRLTRDGLIRQEQASPGFVPRVFPDLAAWLRAHRLVGRSSR